MHDCLQSDCSICCHRDELYHFEMWPREKLSVFDNYLGKNYGDLICLLVVNPVDTGL